MEQLSEEREREYLRGHMDSEDGYGVLVMQCTIRDLNGKRFHQVEFGMPSLSNRVLL